MVLVCLVAADLVVADWVTAALDWAVAVDWVGDWVEVEVADLAGKDWAVADSVVVEEEGLVAVVADSAAVDLVAAVKAAAGWVVVDSVAAVSP